MNDRDVIIAKIFSWIFESGFKCSIIFQIPVNAPRINKIPVIIIIMISIYLDLSELTTWKKSCAKWG